MEKRGRTEKKKLKIASAAEMEEEDNRDKKEN
jgi:hypothetical protein